ncbi:MAG: cytochrome c3 family protein [Candidatus Zixiibacteriota bacterium]
MIAFAAEDNCLTCHKDIEDEDGPAHLITRDIHFQNGLGCADCHGGDPSLDDMDDVRKSAGYRGVPNHLQVPDFCARCHSNASYMRNHNPSLPTDQLDKYKTSVHGKRLFENRDTKVANCVSCHAVHQIGDGKLPHSSTHPVNVPATCGKCHADPAYMVEYNIPTTQLDDYLQSVHGKALIERNDLGAPACNDCHSNHGAAPPGHESLAAVCGNCHVFQMELFDRSPHKTAFAENDFPMCETCHSNHRIEKPHDAMVGTSGGAVCADCHSADDGTRAFVVADTMSTGLYKLVSARDQAKTVLDDAIAKGMLTTDVELMLGEVDQALIKARTAVHAFGTAEFKGKADTGIAKADTVLARSKALIDNYFFRRKGLALATLFITIVAVCLYLRIRKLG